MKKKTNAFKNKGQKTAMSVVKKVPPRRIVEYYYFPEGDVSARNILQAVGAEFADKADIWPDLNLQMEFDVKLFNKSLATNTIDELRLMVKSYFNRITTVHSPNRDTNMDNNIYVSHLIQQMEAHDSVAWMKFKGWYTNQKGKTNSNYKDANTQAIELKWNQLEDMDKYILLPDDPDNPLNYKYSRLENYTPEMFILEDNNIKINIV